MNYTQMFVAAVVVAVLLVLLFVGRRLNNQDEPGIVVGYKFNNDLNDDDVKALAKTMAIAPLPAPARPAPPMPACKPAQPPAVTQWFDLANPPEHPGVYQLLHKQKPIDLNRYSRWDGKRWMLVSMTISCAVATNMASMDVPHGVFSSWRGLAENPNGGAA